MKQHNRVLSRTGARDLTQEEIPNIQGGIRTLTLCSFYNGKLDGDISEC